MFIQDLPDYDGHEEIRAFHHRESGLTAIISIHRSVSGLAGGGTRMFDYPSLQEATSDVLRLSQAMSYKYALAEIPCGGGKAVIVGNPREAKTRDLLLAFGAAVATFEGRYFAGPDVGTTGDDMRVVSERTPHVRGLPERTGDSSLATAIGVHHALKAALRARLGTDSLAGVRLAIQGIGGVGGHLARRAAAEGAVLFVADVDAEKVRRICDETGATEMSPSDVLRADVDVVAPCALGGVLTQEFANATKARIVCGGANNQLATPEVGETLASREILFVPDYVANAGGVIIGMRNDDSFDPETAYACLARIEATCSEIFRRSRESGRRTEEVAQEIAQERLAERSATRPT